MTARNGDTQSPCCARLASQHESEQAALRRRIVVLESALERERESSSALAAMVMLKAEPS